MKLFVAYDFENDTSKRLSIIQNKLKKHSESGKWPYYKNIHLTIKYIDEVDEDNMNDLIKILDMIFSKNYNLDYSFNELGLFRSKDIIRFAWISLKGNNDILNKIHNNIDYELSKLDLKREKKKYLPHIILGRDIIFNNSLFNLNEIIKEEMNHSFSFKSATLYQNMQKDNKVVYEPIKTYYFKKR